MSNFFISLGEHYVQVVFVRMRVFSQVELSISEEFILISANLQFSHLFIELAGLRIEIHKGLHLDVIIKYGHSKLVDARLPRLDFVLTSDEVHLNLFVTQFCADLGECG